MKSRWCVVFLIRGPLLFRAQLFIYGSPVYYYDVFAEIVLFGELQSDLTYFKKTIKKKNPTPASAAALKSAPNALGLFVFFWFFFANLRRVRHK